MQLRGCGSGAGGGGEREVLRGRKTESKGCRSAGEKDVAAPGVVSVKFCGAGKLRVKDVVMPERKMLRCRG
jgi:hypothetical protein